MPYITQPTAGFLWWLRSSWKLGLEAKAPSAMPMIDLTSWAWQPLPMQVTEGLAGFEGDNN